MAGSWVSGGVLVGHWLQAERELDIIPEALERDLIGTLHGNAADVAEEQHTVGYFPGPPIDLGRLVSRALTSELVSNALTSFRFSLPMDRLLAPPFDLAPSVLTLELAPSALTCAIGTSNLTCAIGTSRLTSLIGLVGLLVSSGLVGLPAPSVLIDLSPPNGCDAAQLRPCRPLRWVYGAVYPARTQQTPGYPARYTDGDHACRRPGTGRHQGQGRDPRLGTARARAAERNGQQFADAVVEGPISNSAKGSASGAALDDDVRAGSIGPHRARHVERRGRVGAVEGEGLVPVTYQFASIRLRSMRSPSAGVKSTITSRADP